jgi:hypothetical protein
MPFNFNIYVEIRNRKVPNLKGKCKQFGRDVQVEECIHMCGHERRKGEPDVWLKQFGPRLRVKART